MKNFFNISTLLNLFKIKRHWPWLILFLAGCASVSITQFNPLDELYGQASPKDRIVAPESDLGQHYLTDIQPIIENRCVVCHGCYDAPCQLKMSSPDGIDRGASTDTVYDGTRILALEPTRLGVDASSTFEWRQKNFHAVLNERTQTSDINLQASLIQRLLDQKQQHPLPEQKKLSSEFNLGTQREDQCPTLEQFDDFANENPLAGMPYGLPALNNSEHKKLSDWIASGSAMSNKPALEKKYLTEINKWERFLNQDSFKHQLAARYIFEHTYLAHLYFSELAPSTSKNKIAPKEYFRLVRSATPPGFKINPITSRRPYDHPGVSRVYYRLQRVEDTILAKTHMPYELSAKKMQWMQSLFIKPKYEVKTLPSYEPEVAANPFIAFKDLPVKSRYRFMLEESQFIIMGFIKGPVCRGQIALNVIDDHFWVFFTDPDSQPKALGDFLYKQSENLVLPGEKQSNAGIIKNWVELSLSNDNYLSEKHAFDLQTNKLNKGNPQDLDFIWDGYGENKNAALTIFRHFDSSTVAKGLVGQEPKTTWVIDYPLLERIHYLLVAEFDVFGNVGHQLNTRLYMDFLRMEGEANFLALLPPETRKQLWQHWYRNSAQQVKEYIFGPRVNLEHDSHIQYKSDNPKTELLSMLKTKLGKLAGSKYNPVSNGIDGQLKTLQDIPAAAATLMPELSMLSVQTTRGLKLFSILRNSGHSNIDTLIFEDENRLPEEDYLTITSGITGTHPGALWHMQASQVNTFTKQAAAMKTELDYEKLMDNFGIRRTNKQFWPHSDMIIKQFKMDEPLEGGLLDYNRLENR